MKNPLFRFTMVAAVTAFAGCGVSDDDKGGGASADAGVLGECVHDSNCADRYGTQAGTARPYCDFGDERTDLDNRCVTCLAATSRESLVFDVGCFRGDECLDGRCVEVAPACSMNTERTDCDETHPHCVLGVCAQCRTDSDCPFHGEDDCLNVQCTAGVCSAEDVCRCDENADCSDGDQCTTDVCSVERTCRHFEMDACVPEDNGGEGEGENGPECDSASDCAVDENCESGECVPESGGGGESVTFRWTKSGSGDFDTAEFSAKVNGGPMVERCEEEDARSITCTVSGLESGDQIDISVEYRIGSATSWSCLGSGTSGDPNGTLEGTDPVIDEDEFDPVANGTNPPGCNLRTDVP